MARVAAGNDRAMKGDCFQYLADEGRIQGSVLTSFPINGSS
jgi:hypothetical protein